MSVPHSSDYLPCAKCGAVMHLDKLDAKPVMTRMLKLIRLVRGQRFMLEYAADRGFDFDRLECAKCYGPGYMEIVK